MPLQVKPGSAPELPRPESGAPPDPARALRHPHSVQRDAELERLRREQDEFAQLHQPEHQAAQTEPDEDDVLQVRLRDEFMTQQRNRYGDDETDMSPAAEPVQAVTGTGNYHRYIPPPLSRLHLPIRRRSAITHLHPHRR